MSDGNALDPTQRQFDAIHKKLDRLDEAIRGKPGNGSKPSILVRLDRLEQAATRQARLIWMIVGTLLTVIGSALVGWLSGGVIHP